MSSTSRSDSCPSIILQYNSQVRGWLGFSYNLVVEVDVVQRIGHMKKRNHIQLTSIFLFSIIQVVVIEEYTTRQLVFSLFDIKLWVYDPCSNVGTQFPMMLLAFVGIHIYITDCCDCREMFFFSPPTSRHFAVDQNKN